MLNRLYSIPFMNSPIHWGFKYTNLELGVALEEQDIDGGKLADVAVLLEFLADLGANGGHRHVQRVHGLDFRGLVI